MDLYITTTTPSSQVATPYRECVPDAVERVLDFISTYEHIRVQLTTIKRDHGLVTFLSDSDDGYSAKLTCETRSDEACFTMFVTHLVNDAFLKHPAGVPLDPSRRSWTIVDSALFALLDDSIYNEAICSPHDVERLRTEWEGLLKHKRESVRSGHASGEHVISLPSTLAMAG
jgi:hypothetical protein